MSAVIFTEQEAKGVSFFAEGAAKIDVVKYDLVQDIHDKTYMEFEDAWIMIGDTFQRSGFQKERLCYTQREFGLFQRS